jgi:hypothetical protein
MFDFLSLKSTYSCSEQLHSSVLPGSELTLQSIQVSAHSNLVRLWQGVLHTDRLSPHSGIVCYGGNSSVVFYGRTGPASEYTR